jgi:DNA-binding PadR family transcriptional regulator
VSFRHTVLGLLAQRPRHGYELRAALEALIGGKANWDIKPAQIYTTLARLENSGLVVEQSVEQDVGPERRIYAITLAGTEALQTWFAEASAADHQRDEFFVKLMLGLASGVADPFQLIHTQRAQLYTDLHTITAQRTCLDPRNGLAHILLLEKVAMHLEADLRWLDMTEARLDEIKRQPLPQPEAKARGRPRKAAGG